MYSSMATPHTIFIIPYRDRAKHKEMLDEYLELVLKHNEWEEGKDVLIWYAHQCDQRPFNRGAMKNMGLFAAKKVFPSSYRDITLVFHDVDSIPVRADMIPYRTITGVVAHYYGYKWALGGIVAMKAGDFEDVGGFPNFWGWGLEDNCLHMRCEDAKLERDHRFLFDISDRRIRRPFDGVTRTYSNREANILKSENPDKVSDLKDVSFKIEGRMLNVTSFTTGRNPDQSEFAQHDIRSGSRIPVDKRHFRRNWNMFGN